jgi:hypothetical protein
MTRARRQQPKTGGPFVSILNAEIRRDGLDPEFVLAQAHLPRIKRYLERCYQRAYRRARYRSDPAFRERLLKVRSERRKRARK